MKNILYGEEFSHLVPLLFSKEGNGFVHSRFANGFNIKIGDSLIFIGNKKNGKLPFGIHLREEDTFRAVSLVNNNELLTWNGKKGYIELPNISISLENGKSFKNELTIQKNYNVFESSLDRLCSHMMNIEERTGLDVYFPDFIKNFQVDYQQNLSSIEHKISLLMKAAISSDESLMDETFRYFLGRGAGLTPSGDDMIVGLLAFDAVSHFLSPRFYEKLSQLVEGESITTDVAREYIRYALKKEYSSTVSDLVNILANGNENNFKEVLHNLLGVGHSSGLDTLLGILIGMLIYKTINKTEIQ